MFYKNVLIVCEYLGSYLSSDKEMEKLDFDATSFLLFDGVLG